MLVFRGSPLWTLERLRAHYGARFAIRPIGMPPLVFLADPDDARAVFTAPADVLHPGDGGRAIEPIVGSRSFVLADGDAHRRGRKLLRTLFSPETARRHAAVVRAVTEEEIASWPRGRTVALHPLLRALTLRVILRLVFGVESPRVRELHARLLTLLDVTSTAVLTVPLQRRLPGGRAVWRRFLHERRRVDELIHALVAGHVVVGDAPLLDLLHGARDDNGCPLSTGHMRDTIMSVVLAGHETTAGQLAWAFQLLAHDQGAQLRLAEELDDGAGPATPYLTATTQEVLRHRCVLLFAVPRTVIAPIEIGGWTYRSPAQLLVCTYLLHHDPALHAEPQRFRPERFLGSAPERTSWLPWGGGRRRCPGRHLALVELETVLAEVVRRVTVEPVGARIERASWRSVIVTPYHGSRVVLRDRRSCRRRGPPPAGGVASALGERY